jgi:hypothetical protein
VVHQRALVARVLLAHGPAARTWGIAGPLDKVLAQMAVQHLKKSRRGRFVIHQDLALAHVVVVVRALGGGCLCTPLPIGRASLTKQPPASRPCRWCAWDGEVRSSGPQKTPVVRWCCVCVGVGVGIVHVVVVVGLRDVVEKKRVHST